MNNLPNIGDVIDGTYVIEGVLGKGGFGAVYKARQLNMDRDVALKLLVASGPKFGEMVKRFRREVMAIRNLTHPNTVRVYDFRDNPEGLLYYTMEALKGKTLKEEIKANGPLSPRRLKQVLRQVLKSLSEAHSHNIVHRDLKPANIMLVEMHGETDFVKVLDFGIAKVMQDGVEEGEEAEELTSAGILVGTLRYMSPEQITGGKLGPQADLYALGLIAVEMLTGESVFAGTGRWDVLHAQISEDAVPVPAAVQQSVLGPVIMRCLRKPIGDRFPDADAVLSALDEVQTGELSSEPLYRREGDGWVLNEGAVRGVANGPAMMPVGDDFDDEKTMMTELPAALNAPGAVSVGVGESGALRALTPGGVGLEAGNVSTATQPEQMRQTAVGYSTAFQPAVNQEAKAKSKAPMVLVALVVMGIAAGGALYMIGQNAGDETEESALVVAGVDPQGGGAVEEEPALAAPVREEVPSVEEVAVEEGDIHRITVQSGDIRATVFVDEELRGRTPYVVRLMNDEAKLRLEARGYQDLELVLNRETAGEIDLEMEPEEESRSALSGRAGTNRGSAGQGGASQRGGSSGHREERGREEVRQEAEEQEARNDRGSAWVDIGARASAASEAEEVEEEKAGGGGGGAWVDLSPSSGAEKSDGASEEAEKEIPLF